MKKVKNQHGDVILEMINSIPKTAKKITISNGFIMEKGKGVNPHTIPIVDNVSVLMDDGDMYLNVLKDIEITHQEHGAQIIEPGLYKKNIERQFDYELEVERKVTD